MNEAKFYTQKHAEINGRNVWLYLVSCPIGNIFVLQCENEYQELITFFHFNDLDSAEAQFERICIKIVRGAL